MIGRVFFPYLYISLTGLFFSCASNKDVQADDYLSRAKELLKTEQFQMAKQYIDSIRINYPKEFSKIREGISVMREINFAEQKRTLAFCDSVLKARQSALPDAQKNFIFEKDAEYESVGNYVYKTQVQENNYGRTFLQTKVDENGNLVLTSYYSSSRSLDHNSVRASIKDGLYVESLIVPKDGALNYTFNDGGIHYEIVRFNKKAENGVINFILSHENEAVSIGLSGEKNSTYSLSANDKLAMKSASELSVILSDITRLLNEIRLSQAKMDYIYQKQENQKDEVGN
jgi:vacuolar-type H+-ATPase subunit I/STV1